MNAGNGSGVGARRDHSAIGWVSPHPLGWGGAYEAAVVDVKIGRVVCGRRFRMLALRHSADKKEERDGDEVENGDALVVRGQKPGADAVSSIQIVLARQLLLGSRLRR